MTKETNTNTHPALNLVDYSTHTFHKKKAIAYTLNYAIIDGIIMEIYSDHTIKEIATILNEYEPRIRYRIGFLQKYHPETVVKKNSYAPRGSVVNKGTHRVQLSNVGLSKKVNV